MNTAPLELPTSTLYKEYHAKKRKKKKLKKKCCLKYTKKKGKYCGSCPTLYALCNHAGRDL